MDDGRSGKSQGDEGARQMREGTERRGKGHVWIGKRLRERKRIMESDRKRKIIYGMQENMFCQTSIHNDLHSMS